MERVQITAGSQTFRKSSAFIWGSWVVFHTPHHLFSVNLFTFGMFRSAVYEHSTVFPVFAALVSTEVFTASSDFASYFTRCCIAAIVSDCKHWALSALFSPPFSSFIYMCKMHFFAPGTLPESTVLMSNTFCPLAHAVYQHISPHYYSSALTQ